MAIKKAEFIGGGDGIRIRIPRIPRRLSAIAILVAMLAIGGFMMIPMFFTYVEPNELGIKQVNLAILGNEGIRPEPLGPGFAFRIPGAEVIHTFPRQVQVLDLTNRSDEVGPSRMPKIQTSDGFFVDVDVSILYRITDPYLVITTLGRGQGYLDNGILPRAEPALKKHLGELTTEEFYNSPMRVAKAEQARRVLDEEVRPFGMEVQQVLIRFFEYSDEIQKNIEAKKLQDQLVFKNQSQARAATEEAQRLRIMEEGEAKVAIALQGGEAYKVEKEAERDLYVRKKEAEGDLLLKLAEAKRTELRNQAMQAAGADKAVALEMAEVLRGLEVIIVPSGGQTGFNPLDLDALSVLFGVDERPRTPAPATVSPFEPAPLTGEVR